MRAREHETDDKRVTTSSHSKQTMEVEAGKKADSNAQDKANRELDKIGLTVDDVAKQSAYEDDRTDVAAQASDSGRNKQD